jgi:hypothetical protein
MKITLDRHDIENIDLTDIRSLVVREENQFDTGPQPYKLYAYLSTLFNNTTILDIGTEWGNSALSFSYNENNHVISYDIYDKGANEINRSNITFKVMDFMQDETIPWDEVSIIMIDVDPHDAIQEPKMLEFIKNTGWNGLLILDDIGMMFPNMNSWFSTIEAEKYELSSAIGHYSGTGLVNLGNLYDIEITNC